MIFRFLPFFLLLILQASCSSIYHGNTPIEKPSSVPSSYQIAQVPFYPQEIYLCGPATLKMLFDWHDHKTDYKKLSEETFSPEMKGSLQLAMLSSVRKNGFIPYTIGSYDELLKEISSNSPVIILQNLGLDLIPKWHYAVVTGYDTGNRTITLHTGITENYKVGWKVFERTWNRAKYWGIVVTPTNKIPASVDLSPAHKKRFLNEITGFERLEDWDSAVKAYQTALIKWPQNRTAHIGLSNSYYQKNDLLNAEKTLSNYVKLQPGAAVAHNNLAHILMLNGKSKEAERHALKAISLGGKNIEIFNTTLKEIRESKKTKLKAGTNKNDLRKEKDK